MTRAGSRSRLVLPALLCAVLFSALAARRADISVVDGRGTRVTLKTLPKRIVSLSPGTTEMLYALGLKGRIVADTSYCDFPPEAKSLPHVGDSTISTEKVIAQDPDLVVASGSANRTAIPALERLEVPIFAVDPTTFQQTYAALRLLGKITGQSQQAEQVIASMATEVKQAQAAIPKNAARPKVLWIVQMDPLIVVGANNFMDELITMAGGDNAGRAAGNGWPSLSPERVIVMRPDVIIAGRQTAPRVKNRAGWGDLPAVAKGRVVTLSADEAVRPGPRLVLALKQMVNLLHPSVAAGRR